MINYDVTFAEGNASWDGPIVYLTFVITDNCKPIKFSFKI